MEHIEYIFDGTGPSTDKWRAFSIAGVVASGNLEVMMAKEKLDGKCVVIIDTAVHGFGNSWKAVFTDFMRRHKLSDIRISVNDNAASPAVVSMRLDQAFDDLTTECSK